MTSEIYEVTVKISRRGNFTSDGMGTKKAGMPIVIQAAYAMQKHGYSARRQNLRRLESGPGVETKELGFFLSEVVPFPVVLENDIAQITACALAPNLVGKQYKIVGVRAYEVTLQLDFERERQSVNRAVDYDTGIG